MTKGTNLTGFDRILWRSNKGDRSGGGSKEHRCLVTAYARACDVDVGFNFPNEASAGRGVAISDTGLFRGMDLLPCSALLDEQLDSLLSELHNREDDEPSQGFGHRGGSRSNARLETSKRIVRKHTCNFGLGEDDMPHSLLGCALVFTGLLVNSQNPVGQEPVLPQMLSRKYVHELAQSLLPFLLRSAEFAASEGLLVLSHMGKYITEETEITSK